MPRPFRWLLVLLVLALAWQGLRQLMPEQERAVRSQAREELTHFFPQAAREAGRRFGMRRLSEARPGASDVLLVHGLDDPGKVWMNMAPALRQAGYGVLLIDYPNDQPIRDSALFLRRQLASIEPRPDVLSIVAHSMGGLVTREMLTTLDRDCGASRCGVPKVHLVVMIGTPNHGSQLARLRGLGEVREQASRLLAGEAGWLDWIFDGAGEAGLDLLPGSEFLQALNARPQPPGVEQRVIAGVIGAEQLQKLEQLLIEHAGERFNGIHAAGDGWGDGLVSLNSTQLPGVPLHKVDGNHLSIVRNISPTSQRVPPALPLVLQLLDGKYQGVNQE